MKRLVATVLTACAFSACAGPPTKTSLNGVALGSTLEQVVWILAARHPNCEFEALGFPDEVHSDGVAQVTVSAGPGVGYPNCGAPQSSSEQTGHLSVQLVSKEVDSVGGAFEISFAQYFSPQKLPTPTLGTLLARLKAEYGEPTETKIKRSQAIGPTDAPIPNLLFYQLHVGWFDKPSSESGLCAKKTCSQVVLSATLSAHAPPGKIAEDLPAGSMLVDLQDLLLSERQRAWYGKKRDAKK